MDNYKIKVKDEAESKEAQELFFQLGCEWRDSKKDISNLDAVYIYADDGVLTFGFNDFNFRGSANKELTLPQLRDLVVLKRCDMNDATHKNRWDGAYKNFVSSTGEIYDWHEKQWVISPHRELKELVKIKKSVSKDQGLISGAEALRALADGKEVEGFSEENEEWIPIVYFSVQEVVNGLYKFRLKPQTIKLELELPKPFEPEEDCHVYILDDGKTDGYRRYSYEVHGDKGNTFIGIWRTEDEIKQVVEQLRKIRGTNS
ncbi:TPA: hypothetical protein NQH15_000310 [Acinetobacter baumannii]|nr:hypothetical protein [Acinetobacter baumannii]